MSAAATGFHLTPSTGEPDGMEGFAEFQANYPPEGWTHAERAKAAWKKLNPSPELRKKILLMLEIQKASERWENSRFIPNPGSYLNGRYFDGDPKAYPRSRNAREAAAPKMRCVHCAHFAGAHYQPAGRCVVPGCGCRKLEAAHG